MLTGLDILVVEDEILVALAIEGAVWDAGGRVIGPAPSVKEALALIEMQHIDAAILDAKLLDRNIVPVVHVLLARGTPLVVHTGVGLPDELHAFRSFITVVAKPALPELVVSTLAKMIGQSALSKLPLMPITS